MSKRIIFSDNIVQYPNRYSITDLGGGIYELQLSPGTITQQGTALTASNLNAISDEVIFKLKDTSTSTTAYTASLSGVSSYFEGFTVLFKPANTNTAAATININGAGAKSIKKIDNNGNKVNLVTNDLIKNKYSTMTYDGVDFIMNNPSADLAQVISDIQTIENKQTTDETAINTLKNQAVRFAISTGSSNAYGVSLSDVTSYYSGLIINLVPNFSNTGACTLNVNNLGAKSIKFNGLDLIPSALQINKIYTLIYDGTIFQLISVLADKTMIDRGWVGASVTDWNTLTLPGIYQTNYVNWTGISNAPTSAYSFGVLVVNASGSATTQTYYPHNFNTGKGVFTRTRWNVSDWGPWEKILTNANLDDYARSPGYGDDTGASNAYTISLSPAPTTYTKGQTYTFLAKQNNSGASTLNVNNLGAVAIKKNVVEGSFVTDFAGKVAGSTVENPNIFKRGYNSTLLTPSDFTTEHITSDYNKITNLDSICKEATANAVDRTIPQQLFQFDLIKIFEKQYGTIPAVDKVSWLKANISSAKIDWYGYGSCPSGNKAQLYGWITTNNQWRSDYINPVTSNTPSAIVLTLSSGSAFYTVSNSVDNNGYVYVLVATDASDGITPSTIYTDYIKLTVTFKHGDDLVAGDILAGQMVTCKYDGTALQLQPSNNNELSIHASQAASTSTLAHVKPDGTTTTVDSNGTISTANDIARFKKSNSTFTVRGTSQSFTDAFCTANSLVTVSITSSTMPQGVWKVDGANGSFTITSTVAETADITFDYYIQKVVG